MKLRLYKGWLPVNWLVHPAAGHVVPDNATHKLDSPIGLYKSKIRGTPGRTNATKVPVHPESQTGAQSCHRRTHSGSADVQGRRKFQGHMLRRRRNSRLDSWNNGSVISFIFILKLKKNFRLNFLLIHYRSSSVWAPTGGRSHSSWHRKRSRQMLEVGWWLRRWSYPQAS